MKKLITSILILTALSVHAPELSEQQKESKELIKQNKRDLNDLMNAEFSEENLRRLLELLEVEHIDIVVNQAKLESGWYRSRVFREANNLFGMHYPRVRDTYASGYIIADRGRKVAKYNSWQSSVLDFVMYLDYYKGLGYSTDNYYTFLRNINYCENNTYTNILKSMC